MTPDQLALKAARDSYNYPRVFMTAVVGHSVRGIDHPKPAGDTEVEAMTQTDWEKLHRDLLRSGDADKALLGLLSINYWGFYGSSTPGRRVTPERALARAKQVRDGRVGAVKFLSALEVHRQLRTAVEAVDSGHIADALLAVNVIQEFGQMSFGSKVLAAIAPERCGVYDRVIYSRLSEDSAAYSHLLANPNNGMSKKKAQVYQRWCELLGACAARMNAHDVDTSGWVDRASGRPMQWRPVDVERGFFHSKDVAVLTTYS